MYEPTEPDEEPFRYFNPYEGLAPNPYQLEDTEKGGSFEQPPKRNTHKLDATKIVLLSMGIIIVLLFVVFAGISSYTLLSKWPISMQGVVKSTTISTHTAPYNARSVLDAFIAVGFNKSIQDNWISTDWGCCKYYPEGGSYRWFDYTWCPGNGPGGCYVNIATFANYGEALSDAGSLKSQSVGTVVINNCLLSYDPEVNPGNDKPIIGQYTWVMGQVCK